MKNQLIFDYRKYVPFSNRGIGRRILIATPGEQSASVPMTMVLSRQAMLKK